MSNPTSFIAHMKPTVKCGKVLLIIEQILVMR